MERTPEETNPKQKLDLPALALVGFAIVVGVLFDSVLGWLCSAAGVAVLVWTLRHPAPEVEVERVVVDRDGVRRFAYSKLFESIRWDDLVQVSIETSSAGPEEEDFFWLLHAHDGTGCLVPMGAAVRARLLPRLQRLPNFDNRCVAMAAGSVEEARFVPWKGERGEGRAIVDAWDELDEPTQK